MNETMIALGVAALWFHALTYIWHATYQWRRNAKEYDRVLAMLDEARAKAHMDSVWYEERRRAHAAEIEAMRVWCEETVEAGKQQFLPRPERFADIVGAMPEAEEMEEQ